MPMNETQKAYLDQFLSKLCRAQGAVTRSKRPGNEEATEGLIICRDAIRAQTFEFAREQVEIHPRQQEAIDRLLTDLCQAQDRVACDDIAARIKGYVEGMPDKTTPSPQAAFAVAFPAPDREDSDG